MGSEIDYKRLLWELDQFDEHRDRLKHIIKLAEKIMEAEEDE